MKCITLFKLLFICTCLMSSCSLFQKPTTIWIDLSDCSPQQQKEAHQVIIDRIKAVYKVKDFTVPEENSFLVTYYPKKKLEILPDLLEKKGEVIIYESYSTDEVSAWIENKFTPKNETDSLFVQFIIGAEEKYYSKQSPLIGMVQESKVAHIDSLLSREDIKKLFPADASFFWAQEESFFDETLYGLIAVRKSNFLPLNKETVKKAKVQKSQYSSYLELFIELHPESRQKWADFTLKNIDRCLPIVCNGNVVSYPKVMSEITGGKLTIAGKFTTEEIHTMFGFIKSDVLNCPASIFNPIQKDK